jgi:hypothetical protein
MEYEISNKCFMATKREIKEGGESQSNYWRGSGARTNHKEHQREVRVSLGRRPCLFLSPSE